MIPQNEQEGHNDHTQQQQQQQHQQQQPIINNSSPGQVSRRSKRSNLGKKAVTFAEEFGY